jgi:hypothetical protein
MTRPPSPLTMLFSRHTKRREFITLLGGGVAWPLSARAQQGERMRRVGVLVYGVDTDPELVARLAAFRKAMQDLGWITDANVRIDYRFGADDDDMRKKEGIGRARAGCGPGECAA